MQSPFLLQSRRNGGLGSQFIRQVLLPYMRRSLNTNVSYLDKFSGKLQKVFCSSYLLNIVFPSRSRSVSLKLRNALRDFFVDYNDLYHRIGDNQFTPLMRDLRLRFGRVVFLPLGFKHDSTYSFHELCGRLHDSWCVIKNFLDTPLDSDLILKLAYHRQVFLDKLFACSPPIDIQFKLHVVRKKFNRRLATEIL